MRVPAVLAFLTVATALAWAAPRTMRIADPVSAPEALRHGDAERLEIEPLADRLRFRVTLREPVTAGMFTCCHVYVDCDADADTGLNGNELWVRAAVGSRFHGNAWEPPPGLPRPLDLARASWSKTVSADLGGGSGALVWQHTGTLAAPVVDGKTLTFEVPNRVVLDRVGGTTRESGTRPRVRLFASVETTCSEHPLVFDYDARGDGLPIVVDGDAAEWSGGPVAEDAGGELHEAVRFLDLREVWCDHGAKELFLRIEVDAPGFEDATRRSTDVSVSDAITIVTQPLGERYSAPATNRVRAGLIRAVRPQAGPWHRVAGRTIEVSLERQPAQGLLRVAVWSDATRRDRIPDRETVDVTLGDAE